MNNRIFSRFLMCVFISLFSISQSSAQEETFTSDTLFYNQWLERVPKEMAHFYTLFTVEENQSKLMVYMVDGDRVYMKGFFNQPKPTPWNGNVKWFFYNGRIKHDGNFQDGKPIGKHSYYTDNGSLMAEENYTMGRLNGPIYEYYPNGRLRAKTLMKNGVQSGETCVYFKNGKTACTGMYRDGKKEGFWEYYDDAGNLVKKVEYQTIFPLQEDRLEIEFANNKWVPVGTREDNDTHYFYFEHSPVSIKEVGSTVPRLTIINEKVEYMTDIVYFASNHRNQLPFAHEKDLSFRNGDFNVYPSMGYEGRYYRKDPYSSKSLVLNTLCRDRGLTVILEVNEMLYSMNEREYRDVIRGVKYVKKEDTAEDESEEGDNTSKNEDRSSKKKRKSKRSKKKK